MKAATARRLLEVSPETALTGEHNEIDGTPFAPIAGGYLFEAPDRVRYLVNAQQRTKIAQCIAQTRRSIGRIGNVGIFVLFLVPLAVAMSLDCRITSECHVGISLLVFALLFPGCLCISLYEKRALRLLTADLPRYDQGVTIDKRLKLLGNVLIVIGLLGFSSGWAAVILLAAERLRPTLLQLVSAF